MATLDYRPAIDGQRALAVISVFIFHLNHNWLPGGFVGVDVFFVISGYLITSIIIKDCQKGSFSLKTFYQRRIARIFPAFFTVALTTLGMAAFIYSPQDLASAGATFVAAALSVANVKFLSQGNYFELSPDAQPFQHYWSLSVEEQFYIFFPLVFLLAFNRARRYLVPIFGGLCAVSFLACVIITQWKPAWAFYLLPTRAWELLAGCTLAILVNRANSNSEIRCPAWVSAAGLAMIAASFLLVPEGPQFPGFWALLPVLGTVGVLIPPAETQATVERLLGVPALVLVGRMSYSLYLWHWPIFSLIDYKLYLASEPARVALKIGLSLLAATLSFCFIESPARLLLNRRQYRPLAFCFLAVALALCVPLGTAIRNANYINADFSDVAEGGLIFNSGVTSSSVILMGDSNASMYGKVLKEICMELGSKLTVISVAAGDPLPTSDGKHNQLWLDSLAVVQREKPAVLVLACNWTSKLSHDEARVSHAVEALEPHVGRLVVLNQPPILPETASRASIRLGKRQIVHEEAELRRSRIGKNIVVQRLAGQKCRVVDIASRFERKGGEVLFLDRRGRQLYQDNSHLSGFGADFIRSDLREAIFPNARN